MLLSRAMHFHRQATVGFLFVALVACNATSSPEDMDGEASVDAAGDHEAMNDGATEGCAVGTSLAFSSAGCDASPVCVAELQDACTTIMCGCDGKKFWGGCGGGLADKPWQPIQDCADAADPDAF